MKTQKDFLSDLLDAAGLTKSTPKPPVVPAVVADIAKLDRTRNERDRARHRGYDNDRTAPSHAEFIERQQSIPIASPAETLAHSLIKLCAEYGLCLHADPSGIVIEVVAGDWPAIVCALESAEYFHVV